MKMRRMKLKKNKRGISPVVATVLLIAIVVVLAIIIFLWARGFWKEVVMKQGRNADLVCQDVNLEVADLGGGKIQVTNIGNIPIYQLEVQKKSGWSTDVERIDKSKGFHGLTSGLVEIIDIVGYSDYDSFEVIPVILGEVETSKKAYTCTEGFVVI